MKNKDSLLENNNFANLIEKFSQSDVIAAIEKDYTNMSSFQLDTSLVYDNHYISKVSLSEDVIKNVAKSISNNGLKSPLVVKKVNNHYEIIFGRKRLLASKSLNLEKVPVVVIKASEQETLLMLLADNRDQRESNVIETALLCNQLIKDFGYTQSTLADITHQSRCQITNILRLLNLPEYILHDISIGKLSYGHAKALASLPNQTINKLVEEIYKYGLSVRDVERISKRYKTSNKEINKDEERLAKLTDSLVNIQKQSITFTFKNEEDKKRFISDLLKN